MLNLKGLHMKATHNMILDLLSNINSDKQLVNYLKQIEFTQFEQSYLDTEPETSYLREGIWKFLRMMVTNDHRINLTMHVNEATILVPVKQETIYVLIEERKR
jgi:hypothetical protein